MSSFSITRVNPSRYLPSHHLGTLRCLAGGALLLLSLSACSTPGEERSFPDLSFTDKSPIRLNVGAIDVRQSYVPSNADPHVDQLFPEQPAKAAAQWAHDRLQAAGGNGTATYDVIDASAVDTKLPRSVGLASLTTVDQTDRFDLSITVKLSAASGDGLQRGSTEVTVTRSQSISEKTTEVERDGLWYDMTKDAMAELDTKLSNQIDANLAWFRQTTN
jgi:hypothetical protein